MKRLNWIAFLLFLFLYSCQQEVTRESGQILQNGPQKERLRTIRTVDGGVLTKAVAVKDKTWQVGDTIRIKFLNGNSAIQEKVKQYAAIWLQYANLTFEYVGVEETADVKIGFDLDTRYLAWSAIGIDCRAIPQSEPSLNFVWLENEEDEFIRTEVLRCFGHILGLGFEHRSPASPIVFNSRAQVYFENTYGLSEEDVVNDILPVYNQDHTNYSEYDKYSIMMLDIPRTIVTNPKDATTSNLQLSGNDTVFIASLYPFPEDPVLVTMTTSAQSVTFNIEKTGDITVDWGDGNREVNVFTHEYSDNSEHAIVFYGGNKSLVQFDGYGDQLITLNFSENRALTAVYCHRNKLIQLDVSIVSTLSKLACDGNQLTQLDVSNNVMLKELSCTDNQLTVLNVSKNIELEILACAGNQLTMLDVTENKHLLALACSVNQLKSLDLSENRELDNLSCGFNEFITLELSENVKLNTLDCRDNQLRTLDVSACVKLERLSYTQNQLIILNISKNVLLNMLACESNNLTTLDVSKNVKLERLNCGVNKLTMLDISGNTELIELSCTYNQLMTLDISHNPVIQTLFVSLNPFVEDSTKMVLFAMSLPDRKLKDPGYILVGDLWPDVQEICESKKWFFPNYYNDL